ncbi:MAG: (Na+)-NQR maturation NqrM [Gammaproteobacteria bacterium]|jgi:hypothetical protein|nr:MAG: (Na+)-NQR maturation NqrM [Gammaproteobacteria bacterium]
MTTLLLAFLLMLVLIAGMAIGVLFGRKPISGSCGGMKALGMGVSCEICGGNPDLCETTSNQKSRSVASDLFYRADD